MQVINPVTTQCDIYEDYCRVVDELITFQSLRPLFENKDFKLKQPRDLYPYFADILKFAKNINNTAKKEHFIRILKFCQGEIISRVGYPPVTLDFNPIISLIRNVVKPHSFKASIVNTKDDREVACAAYALDQLSSEGIGFSFGEKIYKRMIESNVGLCAVVKNENHEIVGATFGSLLTLNQGALKTFHFWMCARKANYPGINLIEMLKPFEKDVIDRFSPDCISLNVDVAGPAAYTLYKEAGFEEVEKKINAFSTDQSFMVKKITSITDTPKPDAVFETLVEQGINTMGTLDGYTSMIGVYATKFFRDIWYT